MEDADAAAIAERIRALETLMFSLRESDMTALRIAHESDQRALEVARSDVQERMAGFPAEYAKKAELDQIRETAIRLDRTSMSREGFEEAKSRLERDIQDLLPRETFDATLKEWTTWRRTVDTSMATRVGGDITIGRLVTLVTLAVAIITAVILYVHHA